MWAPLEVLGKRVVKQYLNKCWLCVRSHGDSGLTNEYIPTGYTYLGTYNIIMTYVRHRFPPKYKLTKKIVNVKNVKGFIFQSSCWNTSTNKKLSVKVAKCIWLKVPTMNLEFIEIILK